MDVVAHKGPPMVSLPLNIELVQAPGQRLVVWPILRLEFLAQESI